jgi:hypothetical protein
VRIYIIALFVWLISHQPAVLFSQDKSATSNQPAVLFSQNKPAPVISHQPNEQAVFPIGMASSECSFTQVYKFEQEAIKGHRIIFGTTSSDQENASTNVES